jgi:hypothetical protein
LSGAERSDPCQLRGRYASACWQKESEVDSVSSEKENIMLRTRKHQLDEIRAEAQRLLENIEKLQASQAETAALIEETNELVAKAQTQALLNKLNLDKVRDF